ncbi:S-adenosyl-L-methionine-dependent methyltransferase [Collybia nuda]|uniref:S-adenosyl-L-methionine-dependent methyltransferase n=1 Tax=Collybia nuda TaxID=64659 RepID=A0A9P5Y2X4_9AGAR|nr:S-adenosyl-L-methionine-dependent methyltransferase [Collybia nuda]
MSSPPGSDISRLVSIIKAAADNIESFYKSDPKKPSVPSLDDTEPHPLDDGVYPLEVKHSLQMLEGACAQLCTNLARPNHTMLNIFEPACLGVVLRARVADVLLDKPAGVPVAEISKHCGVESRKLSRVLRTLCSNHIFREVSNNVFANNRLSIQLVSSTPMWSLGVHSVDEPNGRAALYLADTLLDSEWGASYAAEHSPFNRATGYPHPLYMFFEGVPPKGAEQGARFAKGMVGWNEAADAGAIVTGYPWDKLPPGSIVNDLGGGWGHIAMQLYKQYSNLILKLQDLPERIQQAQKDVWPKECPEAVADGKIEFKAVDLSMETPIPNCDVYLVKSIGRHNMTSDLALKILSNTRNVMTPTSRILINEYTIQSTARVPNNEAKFNQAPLPLLPNFGAGRIRPHYLDMAMLTQLNSEERTLEDYIQLAESSGLRLVKVWDLGEAGLLELAPA